MFQEDNIDSRKMVFTDKSIFCTKKAYNFPTQDWKRKEKKDEGESGKWNKPETLLSHTLTGLRIKNSHED